LTGLVVPSGWYRIHCGTTNPRITRHARRRYVRYSEPRLANPAYRTRVYGEGLHYQDPRFDYAPACFCNKRRGFQTNRSCLSLPTVSPGSGCESRCVRRGSGASICAGSLKTGLTGTGGGSPIRGVPCLVICAEAETAMLTTPVVGLFVGIGGGRQVRPDQHHGLSPKR